MNPVTTVCPQCAEQQMSADDVRLVHCAFDQWSFYEFFCPGCLVTVRMPAPRPVRQLLQRLGVHSEFWDVPAEAAEERLGPPLTLEDLRDFVLALDDVEDAVEALRSRSRAA